MAKNESTTVNLSNKDQPRIDFYVSKGSTPQFALLTTCRIAEKAFAAGHRIHIQMCNTDDCEKLDALLWTFRDRSFIPHEISSAPIEICPVTISADSHVSQADLLLNLTHEVPENFKQFQRIAEIVDNQPEAIRAGRERYRFYREKGLDPQHHQVSST